MPKNIRRDIDVFWRSTKSKKSEGNAKYIESPLNSYLPYCLPQ